MQKDILLHNHINYNKGTPVGALLPVEYVETEAVDYSVSKGLMHEYIAYEIKDLFGLNLIEYMNLNIVEYNIIVEVSNNIKKERERIRAEEDEKRKQQEA